METEKPVFGIPIVVAVTFAVMKFTPDKFNKTRFAIPVSFLVAIVLSVVDMLVYGEGDMLKTIYTAILRGIGVGFAAVGAHSAYKNYARN